MTRLHYAKGEKFCKRGGHFVTDKQLECSKRGKLVCKEHKLLVRTRPRNRKYKDKYNELRQKSTDF